MTNLALAHWADRLAGGGYLDRVEAETLANCDDLPGLMEAAATVRDAGHGDLVSVSRKVFVPLTQLCRDVCHYCTFAQAPKGDTGAYLSQEQVLEIAQAGARAGCDEVLFTLGDKPELRYRAARDELSRFGHATTLSYLREVAALVLKDTGLLPHINAGVMDETDIRVLRDVSASQGLMLETVSDRLSLRGGAHFGSPDKRPAQRLETIEAAGCARVPFTSGILIGIGETRAERIEALLALRTLHEIYGHIQEIIIQNFRAKPGTRMANAPEPALAEHLWTIAVARLIFGPQMSIQSPPNLRRGELGPLIAAGINDWGGISPVTPDHVNPEAPWPELARLADETARAGKTLVPRLAVYPKWLREGTHWIAPGVLTAVLRRADGQGYAHETAWRVGRSSDIGAQISNIGAPAVVSDVARAIDDSVVGRRLSEAAIIHLFEARGTAARAIREAADAVRREVNGETVTYVVNRNINYTNVCTYRCGFCAFSKGKLSEHLRGRPYDLELGEIARRAREAWARGATEVCMQGGIHPDYTGETYLSICRAVKEAVPDMDIHAFSPLEVLQGARTLRRSVESFLLLLKTAGLGTLPGTAAEILDDEVRSTLCADKVSTLEWLTVVEAAHRVGLKTTSTIMFGHIEGYQHWARHLLRIRDLQERTGGLTEFVPLPFVHMEAPIYVKGEARQGPSFREALAMHAVSRLALNGAIANIQVSWVKMGEAGVAAALRAGVNDLGGTLMNESISRAAGTQHGQEMPPEAMERLICAAGRVPRQRTTAYGDPWPAQAEKACNAPELLPVIQSPAGRHARVGSAAAKAVVQEPVS